MRAALLFGPQALLRHFLIKRVIVRIKKTYNLYFHMYQIQSSHVNHIISHVRRITCCFHLTCECQFHMWNLLIHLLTFTCENRRCSFTCEKHSRENLTFICIQCLRKVFRPIDFLHILLCYSLILKWITLKKKNSTQFLIITKRNRFLEMFANS